VAANGRRRIPHGWWFRHLKNGGAVRASGGFLPPAKIHRDTLRIFDRAGPLPLGISSPMKIYYALVGLGLALAAATMGSAETVLVTGSNRGLGLEFARQYAERGWTVIATARNPESATELQQLAAKHKNVAIEKLDLLDGAGLKALAEKYQGRPIDVLLNNAGVLGDLRGQTLGTFDHANFQQVMSVNVYGPLAVVEAFREHVIRSRQKKIIAITSGSGVISRGGGGGKTHFYRASKVALNMVMRGLANDLKDQGVIVGLVAPGAADTDMRRELVGAERAARDLRPEQSVAGMIKVIAGLTQENSDKPLNYDGSVLPW
jgi:NAD(P)-dependent dehydrogenase (short-subunit alcohol dehydrogenase family)